VTEKYEDLKKTVADVKAVVDDLKQEGLQPNPDQIDAMAADIKADLDAQVEAKIAEAESNRPHRKGEWVGPDGFKEESLGLVDEGKFKGQSLADVIFAGNFIKRARMLDPNGARGVSDHMEKLLTATGSGTGDEFVPTGMAGELWENFFLGSKVVQQMGIVPMPTDPFDFPVHWGSITWRKGAAGEAADAQNPATAKSTFTATEQIAEINWNYDFDEDAVIAVLPSLRQELARSGAEQMDAFALNADGTATATGNINLDDDTPATDAYYLSAGQDGIRHYYLVDRTSQSANISTTLTDALWRAGVARQGKYAASPMDNMAITNIKTYLLSILSLANVRTLDKYGPGAVILNGELASMDGIPLIASESMALAEDDGKVSTTAANNDEGQIAFVNKTMWKVGFRRQLMIEVDRDIRKRIYIMVVSFRIALAAQDNGDSTTRGKDHTAGIHGITY
jgi:HK97 family phage major capsid protein